LLNKSNNIDSNKLEENFDNLHDPNQIIEKVNEGTGDPTKDRMLRMLAVEKLDEKEMQKKTEHFLQQFVEYLEPNPRSTIRFVNIFNIVRAVNILSSKKIDNRKLALWIIVVLRWPSLASYLQKNSSFVNYIGNNKVNIPIEIPPNIQSLFKDKDVDNLFNNKQRIIIDNETIDDIIIWSI